MDDNIRLMSYGSLTALETGTLPVRSHVFSSFGSLLFPFMKFPEPTLFLFIFFYEAEAFQSNHI